MQVATFGAGADRTDNVADLASRDAERAVEMNEEKPITASAMNRTPENRLVI